MGERGWFLLIALFALANPAVIVTGLASGLVVRRGWQVLFGLLTAPAAYWIFTTVFGTTLNLPLLLPFLAVAGVIWTSAAFGLKKAVTN